MALVVSRSWLWQAPAAPNRPEELRVGVKYYQRCVCGELRGLVRSTASISLLASQSCVAGTWGQRPALTVERALKAEVYVLTVSVSRTASVRFEVTLQSIIQERFSYAKAVRRVVGRGPAMVCQVSTLAVGGKRMMDPHLFSSRCAILFLLCRFE